MTRNHHHHDDDDDSIDDPSFLTAHSSLPLSINDDDTPTRPIPTTHLAVLPVLLLEFLALAVTRAVLPSLLLQRYGRDTYVVMGAAECIRGILAFVACPLFGRLSDVWGRKSCLFLTVAGTLGPVCSLAVWPQQEGEDVSRMDVFVVLLALSGMFSSTFTLTFAYISDVVKDRDGRVAAYGLALATFGLSFTIGPLLGGYLANVEDNERSWIMNHPLVSSPEEDNGIRSLHSITTTTTTTDNHNNIHPLGQQRVFITTFLLAVLDLLYIYFLLPESLTRPKHTDKDPSTSTLLATTASESNVPLPAGLGVSRRASSSWWNPLDSIRYLTSDPLLSTIGRVTFLYYTALHAVVSTLLLYAVRQFHLGPHRLGELMAALGLSTMLSEAVLVRIAIPLLGETRAMRVGLVSFALQCTLLAVADRPWHLFACAALAIPGNLVYPSVSSLVSATVRPEFVGRALGAVNGVKSLTEGVGPLMFGTLLTMSEKDRLPGWPYFIAAIMTVMAYHAGSALPSIDDENGMSYKYNVDLREDDEAEDLLGR